MKKIFAVLGTAIVAGTLVFAGANAASATEAPTTKTVTWEVHGGFANRWNPAQTLYTGAEGVCGQPDLQKDVYKYSTPEEVTKVDSIVNSGVLHQGDDYSVYLSNQDIPATAPCATVDATADVSVTAPTCEAPGVAFVTGLVNATLSGELDQTVGTHNALFTATAGHEFVKDQTTKTVGYTVKDKDETLCPKPPVVTPPADKEVTPTLTVVTYCTGDTEYNDVTLGTEAGITWDFDGYLGGTGYFATADKGYKIVGPLANNGTILEDGRALFNISHMTSPQTDKCAVVVTPPVTTPPVTTPPTPPVTAPPVSTPPAAQVKAGTPIIRTAVHDSHVAAAKASSDLAYTGSKNAGLIVGGGLAALVAGLALVLLGRRFSA